MVCKQEPAGAKPPLPGLVKLSVTYQGTTPQIVTAANVLHCRWLDNLNHPLLDLTQLVNNFNTHWAGNIVPFIAPAWSMVNWTAQSMGGDGLIAQKHNPAAGAGTGLPLPPQSAVCISWQAGLTARGGRARTYLPGIPDGATVQVGSPQLSSTYSSGLATAALGFLNQMASDTYAVTGVQMGVPSYYAKCQLRPTPMFFSFHTPVVHDRLDSQRRRSGKESVYPIG
jgi:hypothetical protein